MVNLHALGHDQRIAQLVERDIRVLGDQFLQKGLMRCKLPPVRAADPAAPAQPSRADGSLGPIVFPLQARASSAPPQREHSNPLQDKP